MTIVLIIYLTEELEKINGFTVYLSLGYCIYAIGDKQFRTSNVVHHETRNVFINFIIFI